MNKAKQQKEVKFPENLKIKDKLLTGDGAEIARRSGFKAITINEVLNGKRRMNDKVKRAIIKMLNERQQLDNAMDQIINQ